MSRDALWTTNTVSPTCNSVYLGEKRLKYMTVVVGDASCCSAGLWANDKSPHPPSTLPVVSFNKCNSKIGARMAHNVRKKTLTVDFGTETRQITQTEISKERDNALKGILETMDLDALYDEDQDLAMAAQSTLPIDQQKQFRKDVRSPLIMDAMMKRRIGQRVDDVEQQSAKRSGVHMEHSTFASILESASGISAQLSSNPFRCIGSNALPYFKEKRAVVDLVTAFQPMIMATRLGGCEPRHYSLGEVSRIVYNCVGKRVERHDGAELISDKSETFTKPLDDLLTPELVAEHRFIDTTHAHAIGSPPVAKLRMVTYSIPTTVLDEPMGDAPVLTEAEKVEEARYAVTIVAQHTSASPVDDMMCIRAFYFSGLPALPKESRSKVEEEEEEDPFDEMQLNIVVDTDAFYGDV
jgi:hypothetical protein